MNRRAFCRGLIVAAPYIIIRPAKAQLILNELSGFGAGASTEEVAVSRLTGTAIGNMTARSGLAASFDGTTAQTVALSSASVAASTWGTVGKDWGAGTPKTISYFKCYASSNGGFDDNGTDTSNNVDITLRGSNTDDSGTQNSGTLLHTIATFTNATSLVKEVLSVTNQLPFRYVWIQIVNANTPASISQVVNSELEFKEMI